VTIWGKPLVPSSSEVGVSTKRILAPGAMVCAHSTSRVASPAQPSRSLEARTAGPPRRLDHRQRGGAGRLKALSKMVRSWPIVGEPNESTMTIVCPLPSVPALNNGPGRRPLYLSGS